MRSKLLAQENERRTFMLVFAIGDEVCAELARFANEQELAGSHFTGIGACADVVLGYWDWDTKEYKRIPVTEQVEVVSLIGNVALGDDGARKVHAHMIVGTRDGSAR